MRRLLQRLRDLLRREDAPTSVEYAFLLALVSIFAIAAIQRLGTNTAASLNASSEAIEEATGDGSGQGQGQGGGQGKGKGNDNGKGKGKGGGDDD